MVGCNAPLVKSVLHDRRGVPDSVCVLLEELHDGLIDQGDDDEPSGTGILGRSAEQVALRAIDDDEAIVKVSRAADLERVSTLRDECLPLKREIDRDLGGQQLNVDRSGDR